MKRIQIAWQELRSFCTKEHLNSTKIEFKNKEYETEDISIILEASKKKDKSGLITLEKEKEGFIVRFINNNEVHIKKIDAQIIKRLK